MAIYVGTAMEMLWQVGMVAVLRKMYGLMCRRTRGSPPTGFGCTGEVCTTLNVRKGNAQHRRGQQIWMVEVPKPQLNISQKELTSLLQTTNRFNIKSMIKIHSKKGRSRRYKYPVRSLDLKHNLVITNHLQTWKAIKSNYTFNNFSRVCSTVQA